MSNTERIYLRLLLKWARKRGFGFESNVCSYCDGTGYDKTGAQTECPNDDCLDGTVLVLTDDQIDKAT